MPIFTPFCARDALAQLVCTTVMDLKPDRMASRNGQGLVRSDIHLQQLHAHAFAETADAVHGPLRGVPPDSSSFETSVKVTRGVGG